LNGFHHNIPVFRTDKKVDPLDYGVGDEMRVTVAAVFVFVTHKNKKIG